MSKITALLAVLALALVAGPALAAKPETPNVKVLVCHFEGHDAPEPWDAADTTLDGDYVLNNVDGAPTEDQVEYCVDEHGGVGVIEISARAAENGHKAQLLDERIDQYIDTPAS